MPMAEVQNILADTPGRAALERIFGASKTGAAGAAVHCAPVSITRAETDSRFEPGSAPHRFNRPARRSLGI